MVPPLRGLECGAVAGGEAVPYAHCDLPNARIDAGESDAGVSSGTAVCAIHATACKACVSRGSRNCRIKTDAKCMQLEAETATRPKIQPRLKQRGKDKPLASESVLQVYPLGGCRLRLQVLTILHAPSPSKVPRTAPSLKPQRTLNPKADSKAHTVHLGQGARCSPPLWSQRTCGSRDAHRARPRVRALV